MIDLSPADGATGPAPPPAPAAGRRRRHTARWVAGAVAVVLVVVAIVAATRPSNQASSVDTPLLGHLAPPLVGSDFGGQPVSLVADRGRVVVLDFFASWCPPCASEEANLIQLAFHLRSTHAAVDMISVDIEDTTAGARRFLAQWGPTWPAVPDRAGQLASAFGVGSPPMTFFVDAAGRVVGVLAGPATYGQLVTGVSVAGRD